MLKEQIIDVTRSFLVTDPEAFYENQMVSQREDSPEKMLPIVAYEGYNFLPTLYGYRSYFDVASKLDIGSLASRCDRIVLYQFANYQNILVALCEDGIWTNSGGTAAEAWTQRVTLSVPGVGSYLEWTFCVIENTLYMYRQGGGSVYTVKPTSYSLGNPVENFAPSFLNMSGQMGIFRANGRLGFWDSANSVSWSSLFSFSDFTPSVETLAGFATFNDILGRIVTIKSHGSGFIIYSTKNIVGVSYEATGSVLFSARTIAEVAGIWTSKQVCSGAVDTEQFAYTNTGIKHISAGFKIEDIFPGVYDFLKESREPVYMDFLNGRYLFLSLIDPDYVSGKVSFSVLASGTLTLRLLYNDGEVTSTEMVPEEVDGIPLDDFLESELRSDLKDGLLTQWAISGSKMIPGRVSSMNPFILDDPTTPDEEGVYVENTDPIFTVEQLEAARDTVSLANPVSIDNAVPSSLDMGWRKATAVGLPDAGLTRLKGRQNQEWNETEQRLEEMEDMIAVLGENISAETDLPGEYASQGLAISSCPADTINVYTDLCTIPYSSTLPDVETFSGGNSWEYKRILDTGIKVRQKRDKHHLQRICYYGRVRTNWTSNGVFGYGDDRNFFIPDTPSILQANAVGSSVVATAAGLTYDSALGIASHNGVNTLDVIANLYSSHEAHALSIIPAPATLDVTAGGGPGVGQSGTLVFARMDRALNIIDTIYTIPDEYRSRLGGGPTEVIIGRYAYYVTDTLSDIEGEPYAWKNTYYTQDSLSSTHVTIATESKATGSQENLTWAVYTTENPPEGFDWATNDREYTFDGFDTATGSLLPNSLTVTYPGATFLLQNATTAPIYPDFAGALVYDLPLQKWGKAKCTYRCLMDYSPINSNVEQVIDYTNFGLTAGLLASDGFLRLFSANCTDSFIRYGKLAFSRIGYTYPEELVINFRLPFSGSIQTDVSMDGRSIHAALQETTAFTGVGTAKVYPSYSGQWHTFAVSGNFDIRSISYTGRVSGIR